MKIASSEKMTSNDDSNEYGEIEKVLNHEIRNGVNWYLTKFKDDDETMWLPEENFNTMEAINEFFARKASSRNGKTKKIASNNFIFSFIKLLSIFSFIFFILLAPVSAFSVSGNFDYCNINSKSMDKIDFRTPCSVFKNRKGLNNSKAEYVDAYILTKLHDVVSGEGWHCKKKTLIRQTEETIFFSRHSDYYVEEVKVSPAECAYMVNTKLCYDNIKMICNGKTCSYHEEPDHVYRWGSTILNKNYSCSVTPIYISAENENSKLFGKECTVNDEYCPLGNEMIIWNNKEIVHNCPFTIIAETKLVSGYDYSSQYKVYMSNEKHWLFNVTFEHFNCYCQMRRKPLFKTSEGPYVYFRRFDFEKYDLNRTRKYDFETSELCVKKEIVQQDSVIDLMLAEQDYMRLMAYEDRTYLAYETCLNYNLQLRIIARTPDKFFRINTLLGEEAVVYSKYNNVFLPQCKRINLINIITSTTYCFEDLPAFFSLDNKTLNGYVTNERVIKLTSQVVPCKGQTNLIDVGNVS